MARALTPQLPDMLALVFNEAVPETHRIIDADESTMQTIAVRKGSEAERQGLTYVQFISSTGTMNLNA